MAPLLAPTRHPARLGFAAGPCPAAEAVTEPATGAVANPATVTVCSAASTVPRLVSSFAVVFAPRPRL